MEIVIARVRLLEILVESPPRVNAAWGCSVATAQVCRPLLLQANNNNCCHVGP